MLSLSIVAACIIGCNYAVNCPSGTSQVGGAPTSGSEQCGGYSDITDIATCKTRCESPACRGNCQAFGYSDRYDRCVLYQSATIGSYNGLRDQILCAVTAGGSVTCPNGTEQVQGASSGTRRCRVYSGVPDIGTCKIRCDSACEAWSCQAFGYSAKYDRCETYLSATPGSVGAHPAIHDQILCAVTAGEPTPPPQCPRGTTQVGTLVPTSGLSPCTDLGFLAVPINSIEGCEDYCNKCPIGCCQSFSYSDAANKCVAYRGVDGPQAFENITRGPIYGPDQILCRPALECPAGTSQIGGIGAYFQNATQVYQAPYGNIEECKRNCDHSRSCTAFAFDYSFGRQTGAEAVSVCRGYNANSGHAVGTYSGGYQADQILCAVTEDFSAQSPGLFSVDGMVGYSNGNGQVYMQIPAYVVYGIVALILVNIVCLMVHCWNKSKGNSKDYKTVSMRSDIEEETDIN